MRKRIIAPVPKETALPDQDWLNVEELAEVEITSEDVAHPIESAAARWRLGSACRRARKADDPPYLRQSATASADLAELRGDAH